MDINQRDLTNLYKEIYALIFNRDYTAVDEFLKSKDVKELNMVLLVGLPRLTYRYRYKLKEWVPFLERSSVEIEQRGKDPEELLSGLL